ncbi:metallophosphoesterase family protein [Paenibacillus physcomitrellae]|uniref:Phosphoesterase n=1 Tax=Paenibacillus physcomitrellae TaxID=1619311 RepID=A0ABQ1GFP7_9BACL|nr:metallophosphoesterase family protein [Paenibacillus physcomitrellae]GGA42712.1 phosphoesterase [Paenibacillus physcomitrellae]
MIIGIVSDTHLRGGKVKLPDKLTEAFKEVDYILHLGDWTSLEVYDQLTALAPVDGIAGNNDGYDIIERFGEKKILSFEGVRIGLVHGHEPYSSRLATPQKARKAFEGDSVTCILFGHSHQPYLQTEDGVLLFNPGSPTDKRREKQYSFGLLEINGGQVSARHIFYEDKG